MDPVSMTLRRLGAVLLVTVLLVALGPFTAPAVAADRISMRVEVYGLIGLHVLTLNTSVEETGDHYAINSHYATTGVAGLVVDQTTRSSTVGRLIPASAQPELFRSDTRRNGVERHDQIDYRPDGSVKGSSTRIAFDTETPAAAPLRAPPSSLVVGAWGGITVLV